MTQKKVNIYIRKYKTTYGQAVPNQTYKLKAPGK